MTTENTIPDPPVEDPKPEPTLEEEIAAMSGAPAASSEADVASWNSLPSDLPPEEAPPEEAPVPAPVPVDSLELIAARAENVRLTQEADNQRREAEGQALIADSHNKAAQYTQSLVAAGHNEESAKQISEARRGEYVAQQNLILSLNAADAQYKASLARELSLSSGIPVESLMGHSSESGMRSAAEAGAPQAKLEAKVAELEGIIKKGQVPSQNYSQAAGRTPAPTAENRLLDQYNAGVRTPETEAAAARVGA